ncbi:MAG: hypothetical protein M5R41_14240 [Bacteroidia bacterium]|nr:hypothetical protein [Bacteroidia bacterium]
MSRLFMRLIVLVVLFSVLPAQVCAKPGDLDSASIRNAQVYLDSLWSIYDNIPIDSARAVSRMRMLLDNWSELTKPDTSRLPTDAGICEQVFSDIFKARYYPDPKTGRKRPFQSKLKPYVVLRDSIRYAVITDTALWQVLSGRRGDSRLRSRIRYYELQYQHIAPQLDVSSTVLRFDPARYEAVNAFINGRRNISATNERTPDLQRRFDWLNSYFSVCFSHGGEHYPLSTLPIIGTILLNGDMTEAVVVMNWACYSGETILCRKSDGIWTRVSSYDHWDV